MSEYVCWFFFCVPFYTSLLSLTKGCSSPSLYHLFYLFTLNSFYYSLYCGEPRMSNYVKSWYSQSVSILYLFVLFFTFYFFFLGFPLKFTCYWCDIYTLPLLRDLLDWIDRHPVSGNWYIDFWFTFFRIFISYMRSIINKQCHYT